MVSTRRELLGVVSAGVSAGVTGCLGRTLPWRSTPTGENVLDRTKSLERYRDLATAVADGYRTVHTYVETSAGGLGTPFYNPDTDPLEPTQPQVLFYDLTPEGAYELAGVEWRVPAADRDGPPTLFGRRFHQQSTNHGLGRPHYGLHAWLFADRPAGLFAEYNPAVSAPGFIGPVDRVRVALSDWLLGTKAVEGRYRNTETCIMLDDGGYGVPFVDREAAGGVDPERPSVLLYQLTQNWSYRLVGAEWYVPAAEADEPPTLFGQPFHDPLEGHSSKTDQPRHYGLHAWLFRANPAGMFALSNPLIQC